MIILLQNFIVFQTCKHSLHQVKYETACMRQSRQKKKKKKKKKKEKIIRNGKKEQLRAQRLDRLRKTDSTVHIQYRRNDINNSYYQCVR